MIHRAGADAYPLIDRNENGYAGCGVKLVVVDADDLTVYGFFLRVAPGVPYGILDVRSAKITKAKKNKKGEYPDTTVVPAPTMFWIVKETEAKALRPFKQGPSEFPGTMVGAMPLAPTIQAIADILSGERMQFALRYANQGKNGDQIVSIRALLSQEDRVAVFACINTVVKEMKDDTYKASPNR